MIYIMIHEFHINHVQFTKYQINLEINFLALETSFICVTYPHQIIVANKHKIAKQLAIFDYEYPSFVIN